MSVMDRPPSPVAELDDWLDPVLETRAAQVHARSEVMGLDQLEAERADIESGLIALTATVAQLADIEAGWSAESRDWYHWGLREIKAERAAIGSYRARLQQAMTILKRQIKALRHAANQQAVEAAQASREQRRLDARQRHADRLADQARVRDAFEGDTDFRRRRADLMRVVHELVDAPAAEWGPDRPLGLRLRGCLAAYEERRDQLRNEHGQASAP